MMHKKYFVKLSDKERKQLKEIVTRGKAAAYTIRHANILLKADVDGPNWQDKDIAAAFGVHVNTVGLIRQRFIQQGLEVAVGRKKQDYPSRPPKFDGAAEARLIALSCSQPPEGHSRWTLKLLADKAVKLEIVDSVAPETGRQGLKKTNLNRI
jgi:hypothetical protein